MRSTIKQARQANINNYHFFILNQNLALSSLFFFLITLRPTFIGGSDKKYFEGTSTQLVFTWLQPAARSSQPAVVCVCTLTAVETVHRGSGWLSELMSCRLDHGIMMMVSKL
jgi:hypothetical protein